MSRPSLLSNLANACEQRAQDGLLRRLRTVSASDGIYLVSDGKRLRNFASNDYLGLARHPQLLEALIKAAKQWGVGATAAHQLGGHRDEHAALESELAAWTGRERALLFSTGYMANLGIMQTLLHPRAVCVQDKLNHVCLIDGARLSGARLKRYVHADVESARRQLLSEPEAAALLASDGVFSMDGDIAPLRALADLCTEQQATLMIDDAHGLGVLGDNGEGSVAAAGLDAQDVPLLMATLGKALGVAGAFVAGPADLIEGLRQFARTQIYTTAMPPALAAASRIALRLARDEHWRREKLLRLIAFFRHGASQHGIVLANSPTPIQPVLIGASDSAMTVSSRLEAAGFFVPAIRPPTVPENSARLRVTLSAEHEESDLAELLAALVAAGVGSR
ncbi:MAG TPA: 8-amino-7-oxononanoate synthase [Dokdonella sp.]|uniref:8-amino-7-oxononanoate synthase n=1 Tax=Dokdonella sp. TaxID=2291710 RepID=UPI002D80B2E3|nr:8-amino-7-oxononanoate synthase [Dokdonella sp.]HET9032696.1 8-amino-7-oxononanoate synthase [Dokdonella sp.]